MQPPTPIDGKFVQQLAALNGLNLTIERAEALLPVLHILLAVDAQVAALDLDKLPAIGLPWEPGEIDDEQ